MHQMYGSGTQSSDLWTDEDVCYAWENGKATLIDCTGTKVDNIITPECSTKLIIDGKLVIMHDGVLYNIMGQIVK